MNPWQLINDKDHADARILMTFLKGRLAERSTIEWSLKTTRHDMVKRGAVLQLLDLGEASELGEPWRTAWRLIEESWKHEDTRDSSIGVYRVQRRIDSGERTGSLISSIVGYVRPRLELQARLERPSAQAKARRVRHIEDLFWGSLTSHELASVGVYHLAVIGEVDFLVALAVAIESAVNEGLSLGRRLGWNNDYKFWRLGQLYSVAYQHQEGEDHNQDVDRFHHGIAPSVKLLHAVVERLSAVDTAEAKRIVSAWRETQTPIHLRLWASLSLSPLLTSSKDLSRTILSLDDRSFWDIHAFPEIAELRARRFGELSTLEKRQVERRIKSGPPRSMWPKNSDHDRLRDARTYWSVREYRRIEVAGNQLSKAASNWLHQQLDRYPELREMASVRFGFPHSAQAEWVKPQPDDRFNDLAGEPRLLALEEALAATRKSWDDDPAERASDWIREGDNATQLLNDLEASPTSGLYTNIWDRLGWSLKAPNRNEEPTHEEVQLGSRVLALLRRLPNETLLASIQGVSYWFSAWARTIARSGELQAAWLRVWPLAVEATNAASIDPEGTDLNEIIQPRQGDDPDDLDTLNVPVGRLIDVFLSLCPTIRGNNPFDQNELLSVMRNQIISAQGKAGLIGRHRLVEDLPYFLRADEQWARENLIAPLSADDDRALALWRAIARRTQFTMVLQIIGDQVATRAVDRRLGRDRRGMLASSLVIEALHAFREKRLPAVPNPKVQQTLRAIDDEVRAAAARTVVRYLNEMTNTGPVNQRQPAETVFRVAIAPFLAQVWPQEHSLATRGVSAAFAGIPASSGQAFAEATSAIEQFLVPFDCWSMSDFDLWGGPDDAPRLGLIDTPPKASALLRLLDLTISTNEGAIVPIDLSNALEQIQKVSQELTHAPSFRRLAAVARRR
ncbi:hypothetical protein RKE25_10770 [Dyella sp. BiH032]|uniref:hypothetical protein n=1 Tax=Dyella sp. BiH032 TaxID=3075430 RepID=UPI002892D4BC|nr:hypothetical protein [Dyella sp. BiH032]WNL48074.1 hypothetical protein RKE25_10770 [Dyella sp. BiH032]